MALDLAKLRNLGPEDLEKEERALREEIWKLRLQRSSGQIQGPRRVRQTRHDLARVLTVRREHEMKSGGGGR
jgi:large subunit ribosomal protein L29